MKRMIAVVLLVMMVLLILTSTVFAGGDKNTGTKGNGATNELGCTSQPCYVERDQPQYYGEPLDNQKP